jgi:hypothetical protein
MPEIDNDVTRHAARHSARDVARAVTQWTARLPDRTALAARTAGAASSAGAWAGRLPRADLRALVLVLLIVFLGATPLSLRVLGDAQTPEQAAALESSVTAGLPDRAGDAASRSKARGAPPPKASPKAARATPPLNPKPVAGLSQAQMNHARTIVVVGQQLKLPKRAYVVAVATAMQESNLRNLANSGLPDSLRLSSEGTGFDHDSVGLFQQRPASGWGSVPQLMDPSTSARKFYQALAQVPGWDKMPLTLAAQSVQVSAFPWAYAKHESRATAVVDALTG